MNKQAMINKVTGLIGLCLATHGYKVSQGEATWQYEHDGKSSTGYGDKVEAVLGACEAMLKGKSVPGR